MPRDELDAFDRLYLNHGLLTTWDGSVTMLAGAAVGGGTLVNWMTSIAAPADVRAEWARDHGIDGLDGAEWDADVAAIEARARRRAGRPSIPPKDEVILRGAARLGWEAAPTRRNATDCGDCGSCPFGCRARDEAVRDPGPPRRRRSRRGARIVDGRAVTSGARRRRAGASASRRTVAPTRPATRPAGRSRDAALVVRAPQVVVAAGALRTPAILEASGLDHPAIGRHLRLHPVPVDRRASSTSRSTCGGARCRPPARSSSARPSDGTQRLRDRVGAGPSRA